MSELLKEFKQLRRRSVKILIDNRKLLQHEIDNDLDAGKPRVYSMKDTGEEEEQSKDEDELRGDYDKSKLMNYTMREFEEWEAKYGENTGSKYSKLPDNFRKVAKATYDKEIKKLQKSSSVNHQPKLKKNVMNGKLMKIQDDNELVDMLAKNLKKTETERYQIHKKKLSKVGSGGSGSINEKNRHFNVKLQKEERRNNKL